ncbi:MAG: serine hydrolase, partial [Chitinophagales bacterium]
AIAIMQLAEKNKLSVDKPLSKYLPEVAAKLGQEVTLHDLLTHTAGVANYYDMIEYINYFYNIEKIEDLVNIITTKSLEFTPGSRVKHSPSGYVLLAAVVQEVSGMRYEDYIQENVFDKAGMVNSGMYNWSETVPNKGTGYTFSKSGKPVLAPDYWGAFPFGADAAYCSSRDLIRFERAFVEGKLVSEASINKMSQNTLFSDSTIVGSNLIEGEVRGYGYGWKVYEVADQKVMQQGGTLFGLSADIRSYDKDDYTFIVLSNYYPGTAERVADELERCIYEEDYIVPAHPVGYFLAHSIKEEGIDYVLNNYNQILAENDLVNERVWELNALGQEYMKTGQLEMALAIFKHNIKKFKNEPIAYDSLGETYFKLGDYDKAELNFKERLARLPGDKRAKGMLDYIAEEREKSEAKQRLQALNDTEKSNTLTASTNDDFSPIIPTTSAKTASTTSVTKKPVATINKTVAQKSSNVPNPALISKASATKKTVPKPSKPTTTATKSSSTLNIELVNEAPSNLPPLPSSTKKTTTPAPELAPLTEEEELPLDTKIYTIVDRMPRFVGGQTAIFEFLTKNLNYPAQAAVNNVEGTVYVSFIVNERGGVQNVKVNKGLKAQNSGC